MKTTTYKEFKLKYNLSKNLLFENSNWIVSLRPEQKTPFSMIISIKHDIYRISDLSSTQIKELQQCYNFIESILFEKLNVTKMNYLCLMMIDSIVHFHVFPRYENDFKYKNIILSDCYYPRPVDLTDGFSIKNKHIYEIINKYFN